MISVLRSRRQLKPGSFEAIREAQKLRKRQREDERRNFAPVHPRTTTLRGPKR